MRLVLGIDEAGRGCVLGPMVVAGFLVREDRIHLLREAGARDSKALDPSRRQRMRPRLLELAERVVLRAVPPAELDARSLNEIGLDVAVGLIAETAPDEALLDAPVPPGGCARYARVLRERLGAGAPRSIVAVNRAEDLFPAVGAASVIAKLERDAAIDGLSATHGSVGSGYPSDPATVAFLRRCMAAGGPLPSCVRTKWDTVRRVRAELAQEALF